MKNTVISFKIPKLKHRAHKVLFENDTPFKPKIVGSKKNQYLRKPKHRNNADLWET